MALAVPASVTEKDAPNLVQDAGFESGKAVKWERWGDASVADSNARTGKFSGVLNAQTGLAQRVATAPNATYMASAWLRVDGGGFLTFALKDRLPEAKTIVQGGDYKQVSFTFTTGAQETFVTLYFWMASAGKTAAVDDVTVSLKNDPQK